MGYLNESLLYTYAYMNIHQLPRTTIYIYRLLRNTTGVTAQDILSRTDSNGCVFDCISLIAEHGVTYGRYVYVYIYT